MVEIVDRRLTTLDSEILESWQTDGYLLLRGAIPPAELEPLRDFVATAVDEQARAERTAGRLNSLCADLSFGRCVAAMHEELPDSATRLFDTPAAVTLGRSTICMPIAASPQFFRFCSAPR